MTNRPRPRRMSRDARREQLVAVALPIAAERGFAELSLEDVAARADVTRNLLYHYFPRGRQDLAAATVREAGHELIADWVIDDALPLTERLAANFARVVDHALTPTDAWRVHRRARAADFPELSEIAAEYEEKVIASISLNHLGAPDPPPAARLALTGYLAFAEATLDQARTTNVPRGQVIQIVRDALVATLSATVEAATQQPSNPLEA
jgi:AcrR family transcriptional regulator